MRGPRSGAWMLLFLTAAAGSSQAGSVWVGSFAKAGAATTQEVPHGLGDVPKALILWTASTRGPLPSSGIAFGLGMGDGTTAMAAATASLDGSPVSRTSRRMAPALLTLVTPAGALAAEAQLVGWDARAFTLRWTANDATSPLVHCLAVGGSEVSARVVSWVMRSGTTGPQSVGGFGFRPDVVLTAHVGAGYELVPPATEPKGGLGLGVADGDGNQWNVDVFSQHGASPSDTQRFQSSSAVVDGIRATLEIAKEASHVSMDEGGFTVDWRVVDAAATRAFSLALSGVHARAGSFRKVGEPAPAPQRVGGLPFRPAALVLASVLDGLHTQPTTHTALSLGAATTSGQGASFFSDGDGLAATRARAADSSDGCFAAIHPLLVTVTAAARLAGTDPTGFALEWTKNDVSPVEVAYLALAPAYVSTRLPDPVSPRALAVGDLDANGRGDLVAGHQEQGQAAVLLAGLDGSFGRAAHHGAGGGPEAVALGDLNGDGRLDVVAAGATGAAGGYVAVLDGDGAGGLAAPRLFAAGETPASIVLLDVDRDLRLDVAAADPSRRGIVILAGDGRGGLVESTFHPTSLAPRGLAGGDLDRDGDTDLVATLPLGGSAIVLLGDGAGGFRATSLVPVGFAPGDLALGDLDGDGVLDLVVTDGPSGTNVVLLGTGTGGFGPPFPYPACADPVAVVMADLDDDCSLDVAAACRGSGDVVILAGDGAGRLGTPRAFGVGGDPHDLAALDADGDGRLDLAVTVPGRDQIVILVGDSFNHVGMDLSAAYPDCAGAEVRIEPRLHPGLAGARSFLLDLGDGSPPRALATLESLTHRYRLPGTYRVTLTARGGGDECLAATSGEVRVEPAVVADPGGPYAVCVPEGAGPDLELRLDGSLSAAPRPGGFLASYLWETSRGGVTLLDATSPVATLRVPVALTPATVPLTLTVTEASGCSEAVPLVAAIGRAAPPRPTATPPEVCAGDTVLLDAGPGYGAYRWSGGEASRTVQLEPLVSSDYEVEVVDARGCTARGSVSVQVIDDRPPVVPVRGVRLVKLPGPAAGVAVRFDPSGARGYNLHRSATPQGLGAAPVVAHLEDAIPFTDSPPPGPAYYAVRGASPCTATSGP